MNNELFLAGFRRRNAFRHFCVFEMKIPLNISANGFVNENFVCRRLPR